MYCPSLVFQTLTMYLTICQLTLWICTILEFFQSSGFKKIICPDTHIKNEFISCWTINALNFLSFPTTALSIMSDCSTTPLVQSLQKIVGSWKAIAASPMNFCDHGHKIVLAKKNLPCLQVHLEFHSRFGFKRGCFFLHQRSAFPTFTAPSIQW